MADILKKATFILLAGIFVAGCGGDIEIRPVTNIDVPEWYIDPPVSDDAFYSANTASSRDLQMAVDKAKQAGRADIALQTEVKVKALVKRFQEEVGLAEESEFLEIATNVSKSVASNTLTGCTVDKQEIRQEGGLFRAYVLMILPLDSTKVELYNNINSQQNLYTRFRAGQAFKELEQEVKDFEDFKKGDLNY